MTKSERILLPARILAVLCLPVFLFTAVVALAFNSLSLYEYGFRKYEVSTETGIEFTELSRAAEELIAYFNSGDEPLDIQVEKDGETIDLYTEEESIHMRDVKGLLRLNYLVLLGTGLLIALSTGLRIGLKTNRHELVRDYFYGSCLTLALILAAGLAFLLDFDEMFYRFHLLAFSNDHWSARGYMLRMFPDGFWSDVVLYCVLAIASAALIIGLVAGIRLHSIGKGLHFRRLMS
jgi:integral membrane protein (TIGR01906 family)